jgi:hypothetical protein
VRAAFGGQAAGVNEKKWLRQATQAKRGGSFAMEKYSNPPTTRCSGGPRPPTHGRHAGSTSLDASRKDDHGEWWGCRGECRAGKERGLGGPRSAQLTRNENGLLFRGDGVALLARQWYAVAICTAHPARPQWRPRLPLLSGRGCHRQPGSGACALTRLEWST